MTFIMKRHTTIIIGILIAIITSMEGCKSKPQRLITVCSNDSHSQVEPKDGKGGFAARAELMDSIRREYPLNLLLDAGDMVQGTPYFNIYHGRMEMAAYNRMGYDAVTIGNHEFDYGVDTMAMFLRLASFPIVSCNYDVRGTVLEDIVKPYTIFERGGMKIAVIGFGVSPHSLILLTNFEPVKYLDPIERGNHYADSLRNAGVELIVAISHLGYYEDNDKVSDYTLAKNSSNIDIIFGGHTHEVRNDTTITNLLGKPVHCIQTNKAGLELSKAVVEF